MKSDYVHFINPFNKYHKMNEFSGLIHKNNSFFVNFINRK